MPGKPCVKKTIAKTKHTDDRYEALVRSVPKERQLRVRRVSKPTLFKYHEHCIAFIDWCRRKHRSFSSHKAADKSMSIYFLELFDDGASFNVASYSLFGWITLKLIPHGAERDMMPLTRSALTAWKGSRIAKSRVGVPPEVIFRFAAFCTSRDLVEVGLIALLQYDLYARPSEVLSLRTRDLIQPVHSLCSKWGVIFGNSEYGERTKVGATDDAVFADSPHRAWCEKLLKKIHKQCSGRDEPVFLTSLASYEDACRKFSTAYKLPSGIFTPHVLRHSGPSFDVIHQHRSLQQIQVRGRWASLTSVNRYRKPGRLLIQSSRFPAVFQAKSSCLDAALTTILSKWVPSAPSP